MAERTGLEDAPIPRGPGPEAPTDPGRPEVLGTADLRIDVTVDATTVTFVLDGALDLSTTELLRVCLDALDHGVRRVVLDLADLTFVDSVGVAVLVEAHRRFQPEMRTLVLHNPRGHVDHVLELCGLQATIPVTRAPLSDDGHG